MFKRRNAVSYSVRDGRVREIHIQVNLFSGLPVCQWIGVENGRVQEWKNRLYAALRSSGFSLPRHKVCIAFEPSITAEEIDGLMLPISLGILFADKDAPEQEIRAFGSVTPDGRVELPPSGLALLREVKLDLLPKPLMDCRSIYQISGGNAVIDLQDACLKWMQIYGRCAHNKEKRSRKKDTHSRSEIIFTEMRPGSEKRTRIAHPGNLWFENWKSEMQKDLRGTETSQLIGHILPKQQEAWLAILWSLAGKHPLLLCGAPGCGKTHLLRLARTLLPALKREEQIQKLEDYGRSGRNWESLPAWSTQPSWMEWDPNQKGILQFMKQGESAFWKTGEPGISGLHLEELAQFSIKNLNTCKAFLGQYGEGNQGDKPWVIGSMNPCPCGQHLSQPSTCTCSAFEKERYWRKLDAALLDRFPLFLPMEMLEAQDFDQLSSRNVNDEGSLCAAQENLIRCWEIQRNRYRHCTDFSPWNGLIPSEYIQPYFQITDRALLLATQVAKQHGMNARGYSNLLRLARTIADWAGKAAVDEEEIGIANQFRWRRLA